MREINTSSDVDTFRLQCSIHTPVAHESAYIANLFATTLRDHYDNERKEDLRSAIEGLEQRAAQQHEKIRRLEMANADTDNRQTQISQHREWLRQLESRIRDLESEIASSPAAIIPATVPAADAYVSPNHPLNLALGLVAGLALGPLVSALAAHRAVRLTTLSASES